MQSLARHPFFKDVAGFDFDKFDKRVNWKKCDDGETIVDFEDKSTDVYFLLAGDVRVLLRTAAGKEVILADIKAGEFFGEMSAIDGVERSANVTALTKAEVAIMTSAVFREILFSNEHACDKVMRLLTHRVRDVNTRLAEMAIFDLRHRLYSELLRSSHPRPGHPGKRP